MTPNRIHTKPFRVTRVFRQSDGKRDVGISYFETEPDARRLYSALARDLENLVVSLERAYGQRWLNLAETRREEATHARPT